MGVRVKKQDLGLDTDSCSGQACEHGEANDSLSNIAVVQCSLIHSCLSYLKNFNQNSRDEDIGEGCYKVRMERDLVGKIKIY